MPVTTLEFGSATHLEEPVKWLLNEVNLDRRAWSISPEASVYEAIERMAENHTGALVVLSAQKLDGIITERDYARKIILKGKQSRDTRVHEIMTKSVYYVNSANTIDECMRLMTLHGVRYLPVLEGSGVLGIVSMAHVVKWIVNSQERTIHDLENYIEGRYPA